MLWNASAINCYAIEARDGRLGIVSDLLFDDVGWAIRWLVVDTGNWLSGRKVLLPISGLGQPNTERRHFPVKLTMQQVKDSPDIDTDMPVLRQFEAYTYEYYGGDPYGGAGLYPISTDIAVPFFVPFPPSDAKPHDPGSADALHVESDPHLRSIAAVSGCDIHATDGNIGHVEDFLVDDADWSIRYIKVETRNWWPGERVLISPRSVEEIDWVDRFINVNVKRQKVKDAPPYQPAFTVDGAYDESLRRHYGITWEAM